MVKGKNIEVEQKATNITATACIGALSAKRGVIYNAIYDDSVNSLKFCSFLKKIMAKYGDEPFVIYMDLQISLNKSIYFYLKYIYLTYQ